MMVSWAKTARASGRHLKELDVDDLHDRLSAVGAYLNDLTRAFGKMANRQWGNARELVTDTADDAEETIKGNLAASLILAIGLGVLVGYMIRRGSE